MSQALKHMHMTLRSDMALAVTDTRCLTDDLASLQDAPDLIATKLPLIKLIARHHAVNYSNLQQTLREIPLHTSYNDESTW